MTLQCDAAHRSTAAECPLEIESAQLLLQEHEAGLLQVTCITLSQLMQGLHATGFPLLGIVMLRTSWSGVNSQSSLCVDSSKFMGALKQNRSACFLGSRLCRFGFCTLTPSLAIESTATDV